MKRRLQGALVSIRPFADLLQAFARPPFRRLLLFAVFFAGVSLLPKAALAQAATKTSSPTPMPGCPDCLPRSEIQRFILWLLVAGLAAVVLYQFLRLIRDWKKPEGGKAEEAEATDTRFRHKVTILILNSAIWGIIVLALIIIIQATAFAQSKDIFNLLLPVFGTWVGTLLAFYFSRENFEAANKAATQLAEKLTGEQKLQSVPVKNVMIRPDRIETLPDKLIEKPDKEIPLNDLTAYLRQNIKKDRLPIFKDNKKTGAVTRVVHLSLIDRFIAQKATPGQEAPALMLANLTDDPQLGTVVRGSFAVVKSDATLADAKNAMDKASNALGSAGNCYDVFVTDTGSSDDLVIGWITNDIINENAKI